MDEWMNEQTIERAEMIGNLERGLWREREREREREMERISRDRGDLRVSARR